MPADLTDVTVQRIVVRNGLSRDLAGILIDDLRIEVAHLEGLTSPMPAEARTAASTTDGLGGSSAQPCPAPIRRCAPDRRCETSRLTADVTGSHRPANPVTVTSSSSMDSDSAVNGCGAAQCRLLLGGVDDGGGGKGGIDLVIELVVNPIMSCLASPATA